jgi:hypothetical protein
VLSTLIIDFSKGLLLRPQVGDSQQTAACASLFSNEYASLIVVSANRAKRSKGLRMIVITEFLYINVK